MKIFICGFMGAGKTTLLKKFMPNLLEFDCIDLDQAILEDLKQESLGEWIIQHGFPAFRNKESKKLKDLLKNDHSAVVALGGGSLNLEILTMISNHPDYYLVFLDTSLEKCLERIKDDSDRPLLKKSPEELKAIYEMRRKDYLKAHLVLSERDIKEIEGLDTLVHNLLKTISQKI